MSSKPEKPAEVFGSFTDDCKSVFHEDVQSILLYGSAARGDYVQNRSNINFLVVLGGEAVNLIVKVVPLLPKWQKKGIAIPLFMGNNYIKSSLDSFPMEFLDMKLNHQLVYGENPLENLDIKNSDLRLQCEREIKGKLLHLRQNFISSGLKPKIMHGLLTGSITTFEVIIQALLYLKQEEVPRRAFEVLERGARLFGLDPTIFLNIYDLKSGDKKLNKEQLVSLFEDYIFNIGKLSSEIDRI